MFALDVQFLAALLGDLVDGAYGAASDLFGAQRGDEPVVVEVAQLAGQRAHVASAPRSDSGQLGVAPDLVSVPGAVLEETQRHQPR